MMVAIGITSALAIGVIGFVIGYILGSAADVNERVY